jgi:hypothetical protein
MFLFNADILVELQVAKSQFIFLKSCVNPLCVCNNTTLWVNEKVCYLLKNKNFNLNPETVSPYH